jgi:hypothetical protein
LSEDRLDIGHPLLGEREVLLGGGDSGRDPVLFGLQVVDGDRVGVEGLEQLLPLALQVVEPDSLVPDFALVVLTNACDSGDKPLADRLGLFGPKLDALPVSADGLLYRVDRR